MGRPRGPDMLNAHLRMPEWMLKQVDRIAREKGVARSRVIVDAVKRQLGIEAPNVFDPQPVATVGELEPSAATR